MVSMISMTFSLSCIARQYFIQADLKQYSDRLCMICYLKIQKEFQKGSYPFDIPQLSPKHY